MLTQLRLKTKLTYDPVTGVFTWNNDSDLNGYWNSRLAGTQAGTLTKFGYRRIELDGRLYMAHRLAWFYVYGVWPSAQLDHDNHNRADNRIVNLKEATNLENSRNRKGQPGVRFCTQKQKWKADIGADGVQYPLGFFDTKGEAIAARQEGEALHWKGTA